MEPKAAAVDPVRKLGAFKRVLAFVIAGLMLAQLAVAGAAPVVAGGSGVICATGQTSGGAEQPARPASHHHHGPCCILHCGAFDAAPPDAQITGAIVAFAATTSAAPAKTFAPAPRMASKGAPQSPRAPPV